VIQLADDRSGHGPRAGEALGHGGPPIRGIEQLTHGTVGVLGGAADHRDLGRRLDATQSFHERDHHGRHDAKLTQQVSRQRRLDPDSPVLADQFEEDVGPPPPLGCRSVPVSADLGDVANHPHRLGVEPRDEQCGFASTFARDDQEEGALERLEARPGQVIDGVEGRHEKHVERRPGHPGAECVDALAIFVGVDFQFHRPRAPTRLVIGLLTSRGERLSA
jgi:hypothetical protein